MRSMMRSGVVGGACAMASLVASSALVAPAVAGECDDYVCGNNDNKVLICHVPPGNPDNAHTICISPNAVPAHLNNHGGDYCGPCETPHNSCDLTGDGVVDSADLLQLVQAWGPCSARLAGCEADFDTSGAVGILDMVELLDNWG